MMFQDHLQQHSNYLKVMLTRGVSSPVSFSFNAIYIYACIVCVCVCVCVCVWKKRERDIEKVKKR